MGKVYDENNTISWGTEQNKAFIAIKDKILTNIVASSNFNL